MRTEEERKAYALARAREHYNMGRDAATDEQIEDTFYYQYGMFALAGRNLIDAITEAIRGSRLMALAVRLAERGDAWVQRRKAKR